MKAARAPAGTTTTLQLSPSVSAVSLAGPRAGQHVQVEQANRPTRCPAWTGAAPFSVIASPLSPDTPARSFGFRSGNRAFQVPPLEAGGLGRMRAWLRGILGGYVVTMEDLKASLAQQSGSN